MSLKLTQRRRLQWKKPIRRVHGGAVINGAQGQFITDDSNARSRILKQAQLQKVFEKSAPDIFYDAGVKA